MKTYHDILAKINGKVLKIVAIVMVSLAIICLIAMIVTWR